MVSDSKPPARVSDLPRKQKIEWAAISMACFAAGIIIYAGPPSLNPWGTVVLQLAIYVVGAFQLACCSILAWRGGKKLLGLLWGITAVLLALLALPVIQRFIELLV